MGIFNFLKKKEEAIAPQEGGKASQTKEPYLGDLSKTGVLFELTQVAPEQRDAAWVDAFLGNIAQASFRCGEPQIITGPDGFPYFQLFLPEPNKSFQCYVIDQMKDDFLLDAGYGVVINPSPTHADWVLTYGDILNYHLNKTFYTDTETPFSKKVMDETIAENEQIMIGQPSEAILPLQTRKVIKEFLELNGVKQPKVLLMVREQAGGQGTTQDIVFNITPKDFSDEETYRGVMQTIGWFLPRHYSFVGMNEQGVGEGFMEL
ncbi:hypothetical protein [Pedobacter sp. BMA]|uniref:hypothetical protein n=1 Tax=Pedobacter sp. BMA TaxID=1663685 RepID=UPI00069CD67C|nr:hypothetical protein [Pedobacter sp. BMA]